MHRTVSRSCRPWVLALALVTGCGGPTTPSELPEARASYNEALVRSSNEQLLLNLVRLRYLHTPQFLEVTAVASQSSVTHRTSVGLGTNLGNNLITSDTRGAFVVPGAGHEVTVTRRPTVSYVPLAGEGFTERLVHPIEPATIFSLVSLGWRIDRLLACCVARANDARAPVIASTEPRFGGERFRRIGEVLYQLQERGALTVDVEGDAIRLTMGASDGHAAAAAAEARRLLGLTGPGPYRVLPFRPAGDAPPDALVVRGRSLLGALFYLSHGVEVPPGGPGGRALDYPGPGGPVAVADPVPGALLSIRASEERPDDAYALTRYRGHWYAVRDTDLESKQTLLLLRVLFGALSAGDDED